MVKFEEDILKGLLHGIHQALEPLLNSCINYDWLSQLNDFLLLRDQLSDFVSLAQSSSIDSKTQGVCAFKDLLDMFLDRFWILGLSNDLQQIVVGQEVESGEETSLAFKELVQVLLDMLKLSVQFLKNVDETFNDQGSVRVLFFVDTFHLNLETNVDICEYLTLRSQLSRDILLS